MARNNKGCSRAGPLDLAVKGNLKKVRNYHAILFSTSKSGVARLELYNNHEHSLSLQPLLMVAGKDVIKVEKAIYKGKDNAFIISTKDHHYTFLTRNSCDCAIWMEDIQKVLLLGEQEATSSQYLKNVNKRNDNYESSDGGMPHDTEFIVKIHEESKVKLKCTGSVKLKVEVGSIIISSLTDKRLIMDWTITHIRRFGFKDKNIFFLEAGRKSRLEGFFSFVTEQAEGIVLAVKAAQNKLETKDEPRYSNTNLAPRSLIAKMKPAEHNTDHFYEDFDMLSPPNTNKPQGTEELQAAAQDPQSLNVHKQQNTKSRKLNIDPTYDEPVLITNAWKSNGLDEESDVYSTLTFSTTNSSKKQEEEEDHYWQGAVSQKSEEPLYAAIDFSKKKNKL